MLCFLSLYNSVIFIKEKYFFLKYTYYIKESNLHLVSVRKKNVTEVPSVNWHVESLRQIQIPLVKIFLE